MNLAPDRMRLEVLSRAATQTIQDRFTIEADLKDHEVLLQTVLAEEPPHCTPIPVTAIQAPNLTGPKWRRFVPQGVKNYVRTWAERLHRSI
jgi:hypothetical protein